MNIKASEPLVSTVIITYKRPIDVLKRAVDSAVNQTYKNTEIVIVNDYPEDKQNAENIKYLIESYHCENVRYLSYKSNKGACFARNFGAKNTSGMYLAFLDDDDEWIETKISDQLSGFIDETIGMVYSPFYDNGYTKEERILFFGTARGKIVSQLLEGNICGGCSMVMLSRKAFEDVGGFDDKLLSSQDYDLWLRIALKYNVNYVDKPLARKFLSKDSITINFNKKKQGWERFNDKYKDLYKENPYAYHIRMAGITALSFELGEIKYALSCWKGAIKAKKISKWNFWAISVGIYRFIKQKIYKIVPQR